MVVSDEYAAMFRSTNSKQKSFKRNLVLFQMSETKLSPLVISFWITSTLVHPILPTIGISREK